MLMGAGRHFKHDDAMIAGRPQAPPGRGLALTGTAAAHTRVRYV